MNLFPEIMIPGFLPESGEIQVIRYRSLNIIHVISRKNTGCEIEELTTGMKFCFFEIKSTKQ